MFEPTRRDGILQLRRPDSRWLSGGWNGGFEKSPAAYNITVPDGWEREDISEYIRERVADAGDEERGPALLTGVEMRHARGARLDSVVVYATVGLSNPTTIAMEKSDTHEGKKGQTAELGTVNLLVGTERSLTQGAQANVMSVAAEAKTATLLALAGVTGTTTDAIVVGSATDGEGTEFTGSATAVGGALQACVRDAVRASFGSRYADTEPPESVAAAEYGAVTDQQTEVFEP